MSQVLYENVRNIAARPTVEFLFVFDSIPDCFCRPKSECLCFSSHVDLSACSRGSLAGLVPAVRRVGTGVRCLDVETLSRSNVYGECC